VSLFAPHLFNGYTVRELAYTRAPESVLWAVRSDGTLLGMTYVPDQQVYGWHQHTPTAFFESCCRHPRGTRTCSTRRAQRTINGRVRRYIER
jgi:hypothetical protein